MGRGVTFGVKSASTAAGVATTLSDLDDGSLGLVMAELSMQDMCALALTCKALSSSIIRQDTTWRKVLIEILPFHPYCLPKSAPSAQRWYNVVKHYCTLLRCPSNQVAEAAVIDTREWVTGGDEPAQNSGQLHPLYHRKSLRLPSFFAAPDVSSNPMFTWNSSMQLRDGFTLRADPGCSTPADEHGGGGRRRVAAAVVRRTFPFSHDGTALVGAPSVRYFEVEVLQLPHTGRVNIGAVLDRVHMPWMRADVPAGHFSGTWSGAFQAVGWGVCEGRIYPGPTDTRWHARGAPFSAPVMRQGAVLGCGMDVLTNQVFFTRDGAVVGTAHPSARRHAASRSAAGGGGGGAWGDSSSSGGSSSEFGGGGEERFLESLMSLRRSSHSFGLDTASASLPVGTPEHTMHALDVAHCMFALSLQGGAAVRVNLGQAPFRFDIGAALAAPHAVRGATAAASAPGSGADDADERASVASSAGGLSLGAASGRAWRTSIGGGSCASDDADSDSPDRRPGNAAGAVSAAAAATCGGGAADRIAARLRELARNWSARSYGSEVDDDVRCALQRLGSDLRRRDSAAGGGGGGLEGVLAWLGLGGSARL